MNDSYATDAQWAIIGAFFNPQKRIGPATKAEGLFVCGVGVGVGRKSVSDIYKGVPASLVYEAYESTKNDYWRAEISIGYGIGYAETVVVLVTGPENQKIDGAELVLLGSTLKVVKGIAFYQLNEFQKNLSNTSVELIASGRRIPGTLKLGAEKLC